MYNVKSNDGCAILTADGYTLANVPAGGYRIFVAPVTEATVLGDAEVSLDPKGRAVVVGELVGVRQIAGLPVGYVPVEYLESTGTQCLFTKVSPVEYSTVMSEWVSQYTSLEERHFFGYTGTAFHGINWSGYWNFSLGRADLEKHLFWLELNKINGKLNARIDAGKLHTESYTSNSIAFCPFSIGGGFASSLKCYSARTWKDNALFIDFIPCLDPTGAPCMFDLVSKTPFYNKGTGDFLYPGSESSTYSLRQQFPDWGKLTERGLRRLYHVPEGYTGDPYDYAIENGFKHIVETEKPSEGYWSPRWTETDDEIVLVWDEAEPPVEDIPVESEQEPVQ